MSVEGEIRQAMIEELQCRPVSWRMLRGIGGPSMARSISMIW